MRVERQQWARRSLAMRCTLQLLRQPVQGCRQTTRQVCRPDGHPLRLFQPPGIPVRGAAFLHCQRRRGRHHHGRGQRR